MSEDQKYSGRLSLVEQYFRPWLALVPSYAQKAMKKYPETLLLSFPLPKHVALLAFVL
jgi:hypothetical protein